MKKSEFKQLIKEVLEENEFEKDFNQQMNSLYHDYKVTKGNRVMSEEETYKEGFRDGYYAKGNGY